MWQRWICFTISVILVILVSVTDTEALRSPTIFDRGRVKGLDRQTEEFRRKIVLFRAIDVIEKGKERFLKIFDIMKKWDRSHIVLVTADSIEEEDKLRELDLSTNGNLIIKHIEDVNINILRQISKVLETKGRRDGVFEGFRFIRGNLVPEWAKLLIDTLEDVLKSSGIQRANI